VAEPFLSDWKSKKITVVGGWSSDIGMSKAWPTLMASDLLPETLPVDNSTVKRLREEQAQWVLKSVFSHSGRGVMRGCDVNQDEWVLKLKAAQDNHSLIAQKLVKFGSSNERERTEWGLFFINGQAAGLMARTGHAGVITDSSADLMRPVLIK
jgi:glutathionylspermidine synthase